VKQKKEESLPPGKLALAHAGGGRGRRRSYRVLLHLLVAQGEKKKNNGGKRYVLAPKIPKKEAYHRRATTSGGHEKGVVGKRECGASKKYLRGGGGVSPPEGSEKGGRCEGGVPLVSWWLGASGGAVGNVLGSPEKEGGFAERKKLLGGRTGGKKKEGMGKKAGLPCSQSY